MNLNLNFPTPVQPFLLYVTNRVSSSTRMLLPVLVMGVGSEGQGGLGSPLNFYTWYTNIVDTGLKVLIFGLYFCYFSVFFRCPLSPLEEAK